MIGSWEIGSLDKSAQFFAFAEAYLSSSSALCSRLKRLRAPLKYLQTTVVLFLARHSVELFLKGAILVRTPKDKLHHRLKN